MFQFTTTTIINENKDFTSGKTPLFEGAEGVFKVKRVGNFKKDNVLTVYKRAATDPKLAKVTFTIPGTLKAGFYRIALYVRLSGNNNSYYANDFVFKGKPFYIEFEVKTDNEASATVAARIVDNAKKYMLMVYENDLLKVSNTGATLNIEAIDEYQRITKADLEQFDANSGIQAMGGYMGKFQVIAPEATVVETGAEGFGTYSNLIKDLRLPTAANTRWTKIVQDETPIPGAKYNQYTLYYCVNRGIMGGDAVGEVTKSRTTHVFYVKSDLASVFETALTGAGLSVVTVTDGEVTPDLPENVKSAELEASLQDLEDRVEALESK